MAAVVLAGLGLIAMVFTMLGLDPANDQQKSDFELFYLPSMQAFSQDPIAAVSNYAAAPTPLYFMIQGAFLSIVHDPITVRIVSLVLGALVLWLVWTFPASQSRRLVAIAALLISPYFRGQVWFANGDVLALAVMLIALRPADKTKEGWVAQLMVSSVAVYIRQNFLFLPAYNFFRGIFVEKRPLWTSVAIGALCGIPMLLLVSLWGGIAPPRYAEHLALGDVPATLTIGLTIMALYIAPLIIVRALKPARLIADIRALPVWLHGLIFASVALMVVGAGLYDNVRGGGVLYKLSREVGAAAHIPWMILFAPILIVSSYAMALVVRESPWRNSLVLVAGLSMSISVLIYQRYFDPMTPLLLLLVTRTTELRWLESRGLLWLMVVPSIIVALLASVTH